MTLYDYFFKDSFDFYLSCGALIFLIIFWNVSDMARKYFEKPVIAQFILFFLIYFSFYLFGQIVLTTRRYKTSELKDLKKYEIFIDDRLDIKTDSMVILASNSRYYFLYDVISKKTFIIPERYIIHIERISNKKS